MKYRPLPLLLLVALSACSKSQDSPKDQQSALHLNLPNDPTALDPRHARSLKDLTLVKQLFEGLMRLDEGGNPCPALAERVEISEDSLTYTFYLRDALWNNGQPVTAFDFAYAWSKVLDPHFASDYAHMLYPIKNAQQMHREECGVERLGVTALNEKTLQVELEHPLPYFLELTAFPTYFPVCMQVDCEESSWTQPPGTSFVGNGPFCLKKWSPQEEIQLQKNPFYWDKEAVHLESITFSVIQDNRTEYYLFEKGKLDWLGQPISHNISTELLSALKEKGEVYSYPIAGTLWFLFNTDKKPFTNVNFRKAFAYALNRQEIITHILQGNQVAATRLLPLTIGLASPTYFKDGDVQTARLLLHQAFQEEGWNANNLPKLQLSYPSSERNTKIAHLVQQQVKSSLNLSIELLAIETHVYKARLHLGEYQLGMGEWVADFKDPLSFLELFKYKNGEIAEHGMNPTGWQDAHYTALLDQAAKEADSEKRLKLLAQAEELLMEQMPIAPLYHFAFDYAKKAGVQGISLSPFGLADFKRAKKIL